MAMKKPKFLSVFNRTTARLYITLILLFFGLMIILTVLAGNYRQNLINLRKNEIRRKVEISLNTIQPLIDQYEDDDLTREESLERITELVGRMTYTSETMENYFFMSSYKGIMLVQPLEPWLEGTYQLDAQDKYGNYYIRDLIAAATSPVGEGYVFYDYAPPGSQNSGRKLSYVRGIPSLQCYIGTGMFYNDIDSLFFDYLLSPLLFIVIGFSGISLLLFLYLRPQMKCLKILVSSFHAISADPSRFPDMPASQFAEDSDEHEILSGFSSMLSTLEDYRKEVKKSSEMYRYLYEESVGVRMIIDREGYLKDINGSFLQEIGYTKEEITNTSIEDIFAPEQKEELRTMLREVGKGEYTHAADFDLVDAYGKLRTILFSESFFLPEDENRILITGVDITNRKTAERQARVQQEQLIRADKLSSLGILVAGVAHEVNNPNQFLMSSSLLLEDVWKDLRPVLDEYYADNGDFVSNGMSYSILRDKIPDYIRNISEGSRRIHKIVTDLKTFSREETEAEWSEVSVNVLLETAVNLCRNMIKNATNSFTTRLKESLPPIYGDAQKLEQVFINLIQNACQSLPDQNAGITVETDYFDGTGEIAVNVIDEGCGIEEERLKKIFDPFFTTKREEGGSGLGLSISNTIITDHKGRLTIISKPGRGTKASVILPACTGKNPDGAPR